MGLKVSLEFSDNEIADIRAWHADNPGFATVDDVMAHMVRRFLARQRDPDKPMVVFTGQGGRSRNDYIREAKANGWEISAGPVSAMKVLVSSNAAGSASSRKERYAAERGVPVISYADWEFMVINHCLPDSHPAAR